MGKQADHRAAAAAGFCWRSQQFAQQVHNYSSRVARTIRRRYHSACTAHHIFHTHTIRVYGRDLQLWVKLQPREEREWCCSHISQTSTPAAVNKVPIEVSMAARRGVKSDYAAYVYFFMLRQRKKVCLCVLFSTIKIKFSVNILFMLNVLCSYAVCHKVPRFSHTCSDTQHIFLAPHGLKKPSTSSLWLFKRHKADIYCRLSLSVKAQICGGHKKHLRFRPVKI